MIKKEFRLRKKNEFGELREKGRMRGSLSWGLVVLKGREEKKIGVIVSKKISKSAVVRNKIRRVIYEGARKYWEKWPEGTWGLFLVKKQILDRKTKEIYEEIGTQIAGLV